MVDTKLHALLSKHDLLPGRDAAAPEGAEQAAGACGGRAGAEGGGGRRHEDQAPRLPHPPRRLLEGLHRHPLPGRHGPQRRALQGRHERHGESWVA